MEFVETTGTIQYTDYGIAFRETEGGSLNHDWYGDEGEANRQWRHYSDCYERRCVQRRVTEVYDRYEERG